MLLLLVVFLRFAGGNTNIFFARSHPKGGTQVFGTVGFGAVASRQSSKKGLLPSTRHLAGVNGVIHSLSVSRLPRLVGMLGKSVTLINPHPLLPGCLPLCSRGRFHHRRMHPKVAK